MNGRSLRDMGIGLVAGAGLVWWLMQPSPVSEPPDQRLTTVRETKVADESAQGGERDAAAGDDDLRAATFRDFGEHGPGLDDFRQVLFRPPGIGRRLAFANLLAQLTPENANDLQALISNAAGTYDLHHEHGMLWERWGEIDGPAACRAIFEMDSRYPETELSKRTIRSWARQDPHAAYDWLMAQEDIPLRASMIPGVLDGYAFADPAGAHAFVRDKLTDPRLRAHGFWQVARAHLTSDGLAGVEAYYRNFDRNDPGFGQFRYTVADIHADAGSKTAFEWLAQSDEADTGAMAAYVTERLIRDAPDDVVRTLAAGMSPPDLDRGQVLAMAVAAWTRTNPDAMGIWLRDNRDLPAYDDVAAAYTRNIREIDPEAARAWAVTIGNADLRRELESTLTPQAPR